MDQEIDNIMLNLLQMKKYNNTIKKVIISVIGLVGFAIIAALQMSLNVGINPWDGLGFSLAQILKLKVGNMAIYQATFLITLQFILLRNKFTMRHFMQFFVGLLLGKIINLFYYDIFDFSINLDYYFRLILFSMSLIFSTFFLALIQLVNTINLPLEGTTQVISSKTDISFGRLRFFIDIICVILIIALVFFFKIPTQIREGTIISALLFVPLLGFFMNRFSNFFECRIL